MTPKLFLKIWTSLISTLTLANTDVMAKAPELFQENSPDTQFALKQSNSTGCYGTK